MPAIKKYNEDTVQMGLTVPVSLRDMVMQVARGKRTSMNRVVVDLLIEKFNWKEAK